MRFFQPLRDWGIYDSGSWDFRANMPGSSISAILYSRSAYDASYLSLAESEKIPFIAADEPLHKAVKKDLPWVKRLGEP
jgi:hypothetical protein